MPLVNIDLGDVPVGTPPTGPQKAQILSALGITISTIGGINSILQTDASGNLYTGPLDNRNFTLNPGTGYLTGNMSGVGNIFIPDQQRIAWRDPATGAVLASVGHWRGHDAVYGEFMIESAWRMAIISAGPIQFGNNASVRNAQFLHVVSGASTEADPLRSSKAISLQTLVYNIAASPVNAGTFVVGQQYKIAALGNTPWTSIGGDASPAIGEIFTATAAGSGTGTAYLCQSLQNNIQLQATPLDTSGTKSVLTIKRNSEVTGNVGGYSPTNGDTVGTDLAVFHPDGLWTPGTQPLYDTLVSGASVTWAVSRYRNTQHGKITLAHNATLTITGATAGMSGVLIVTQTGDKSITLPSGSKTINNGLGVISITQTADAIDILEWKFDGVNYYWTHFGQNFTADYDPVATAFFTAASVVDAGRKALYNNFILGLRADGVWDAVTAIWPFEGLTGTAQSKELKGAYNITWNGTPDHSAYGVIGNASNAYGNTGLAPSAFGSTNSQFIYVYNRTSSPTANASFIAAQSGGVGYSFLRQYDTGTPYIRYGVNELNTASPFYAVSPNFIGHIYANITNATTTLRGHNSTTASYASVPVGRATTPFYLLAGNFNGTPSGYTNANLGIAAVGPSLSVDQITAFKARVDTLMAGLGR